jgi:hypothetical protein
MIEINLQAPITKEELEAILPPDLKGKWNYTSLETARKNLIISNYLRERDKNEDR